MIVVTHSDGCIRIEGHAGYAAHGQDIVCAAISTLTQVFLASVEDLTGDEIEANLNPGNAVIQYNALSEKGRLLLKSFLVGVKMIANEYPNHVAIENAS